MANDDGIVIAGGDTGAELLAIIGFKILFRCDQQIRGGIQPQKFRRPLFGQVIGHYEDAFLTQAQALCPPCTPQPFQRSCPRPPHGQEEYCRRREYGQWRLAQKIRSDMSDVKTALSAPTGITEVTEALNAVEGTLGNLSEVDPEIQGETFTATVNNLFGKLPALEITVGAGMISVGQYALYHMEPGDSVYFTSWSGNKFSDQPSDDGHVFGKAQW